MDKEAQKKILANELYMLDNGKHSIDYDAWAGRIILNGYCKLPEDKPPLLEADLECSKEANMVAQREADIKHYEG